MTEDEAELSVLKLATPDTGKFGISVTIDWSLDQQHALERLQLADHVRLIDVSFVSTPEARGQLMRVFLLTTAGWHRFRVLKGDDA